MKEQLVMHVKCPTGRPDKRISLSVIRRFVDVLKKNFSDKYRIVVTPSNVDVKVDNMVVVNITENCDVEQFTTKLEEFYNNTVKEADK